MHPCLGQSPAFISAPICKEQLVWREGNRALHAASRTIHQLWGSQSHTCTGTGGLSCGWPPTGTFLETSPCPRPLVVADLAAGTSWPQNTTFPKYYVFQGVDLSCYIWQVSFIAFSSNDLLIGGKIWGHWCIIAVPLLCLYIHTPHPCYQTLKWCSVVRTSTQGSEYLYFPPYRIFPRANFLSMVCFVLIALTNFLVGWDVG